MKKKVLYTSVFLFTCLLYGQVTLEECQVKALELYPSVKQAGLIERTRENSLASANTQYLPRFTISGKASYQSDVTSLSLSIPGVTIDEMSKDQYQIQLELNQSLWDGGRVSSQKETIKASSQVERSTLEVEFYTLKSRVNQYYFGILLFEEQLKQNSLLSNELETNYKRVQSLLNFGIAKNSDLDTVRVEQLNAQQAKTELATLVQSYRTMLSQITGIPLTEEISLMLPETNFYESDRGGLNRPEVVVFDAKKEVLDARTEVVKADNMPIFSAFIQGGYGRPGLNMLDDSFSPFYIGGLKMIWSLDGFYTIGSDLSTIEIEKQRVDSEKETFLYNLGLQISSLESNIRRLQLLIEKDDEIITLRSAIKKDAEIQLENGTINVNDLIREITEENIARQKKSLHEIQLIQGLYDLNFATNE
jgi:outer membrane protein TolC